MGRISIWIGMSLPTLVLSFSLLFLLAEIAPRERSGESISGSGLILLPLWGFGSLLIAGVMYLIGRALIRLNQQDEKKKNESNQF